MALTTEANALTAALFHLICAAMAAFSICSWVLFFAVLHATRKFRGAVKDGAAELRSNLEHP